MHTTPDETLLATLRSFPRSVWFLFLGSFLNKFGTFVIPFLTLYLLKNGYSTKEVGIVVGAYGGGNFISAMVGGHLADTLGRRKTIVLSMLLGAVGMVALSQAQGFWPLVALSFLVGCSAEMYRPAASALLIDLVPEEQRTTAFACYRVAFNGGWMFGPATGGFLAAHDPVWLFVGDAITCVLFAGIAWFALPKGVNDSEAAHGFLASLAVIRHDKRYVLFLLALFGPGLLLMQFHSAYSSFVVRDLGHSEKVYGWLLSFNGLLIILFELPISRIAQRYPIRRVIATGFFLLGLGLALCGLHHSLPFLIGAMAVHTLGEMVAFPLMSAFVARLAPPHMRGRYMGANGCVWSLSMIFGPGLGLHLYSTFPILYWWVCLALGTASAGLILIDPLARQPRRRA